MKAVKAKWKIWKRKQTKTTKLKLINLLIFHKPACLQENVLESNIYPGIFLIRALCAASVSPRQRALSRHMINLSQ